MKWNKLRVSNEIPNWILKKNFQVKNFPLTPFRMLFKIFRRSISNENFTSIKIMHIYN